MSIYTLLDNLAGCTYNRSIRSHIISLYREPVEDDDVRASIGVSIDRAESTDRVWRTDGTESLPAVKPAYSSESKPVSDLLRRP